MSTNKRYPDPTLSPDLQAQAALYDLQDEDNAAKDMNFLPGDTMTGKAHTLGDKVQEAQFNAVDSLRSTGDYIAQKGTEAYDAATAKLHDVKETTTDVPLEHHNKNLGERAEEAQYSAVDTLRSTGEYVAQKTNELKESAEHALGLDQQ